MDDVLTLPQYYIVEPTNICNYRCPICPNRFLLPEEKGYMELGVFESIILQIKEYAKVIQLYWMGESLLHPKLIEMVNFCKQNTHAKIILSTNGSLLGCDIADGIIDSGIDEIIISLDAATDEKAYEAIREGGNLSLVNNNIEYLLSRNTNVNIVLQFIDMYINRHEREKFKEKWASYNCNINIQCLYSWANQIPSLNLASNNLSPQIHKKRNPCADLWNKMSIHWDGRISICCFDWCATTILGDVKHDTLINIWQGEIATSLRKIHSNKQFENIKICRDCDAWAEPSEYYTIFHLN